MKSELFTVENLAKELGKAHKNCLIAISAETSEFDAEVEVACKSNMGTRYGVQITAPNSVTLWLYDYENGELDAATDMGSFRSIPSLLNKLGMLLK